MTTAALAVLLLVAGLAAHHGLRDLRTLPTGPSSRGAAPPSAVSVVVPARDEERGIGHLIGSLAPLEDPVGEVLVVDDGSRDATAEVARARGAVVLAAGPPPPGWTGKAWACRVGTEASSGDLLLFLDADVTLAPGAVAALLEQHSRSGGLVSVQPFDDVRRPHEQLAAHLHLVPLLASGAFRARPTRPPMAFGPCLLVSRSDLERAGGHAAVRGDVLDDVGLALAHDRAGLSVTCAVGGDLVRMRSHPEGLGRLVAGFTKNIASGAGATSPRTLVPTLAWLCAQHAVAVGALAALLAALAPGRFPEPAGGPVLWALAWPATAHQLRHLLRRVGSFRWWTWAIFPVPLLVFDAVFLASLVRTLGGSVRWRGRVVPVRGRPDADGGPAC
ncbi:glycosyltransferase family 2 protein [Phycicoccus avicenniae]|uniref:glycosyltransferase family 2 protein n=1 Tax=Phycicoccus avicenniae TaxID=2828860 RepID=UPI003D2E32F9